MAEKTKSPYWYKVDMIDNAGVSSQIEGVANAENENDVYKMILEIASKRDSFPENVRIVPKNSYAGDWRVTTLNPESAQFEKDLEPKYLPPPDKATTIHPSKKEKSCKKEEPWYGKNCAEVLFIDSSAGHQHMNSDLDTLRDHLTKQEAL